MFLQFPLDPDFISALFIALLFVALLVGTLLNQRAKTRRKRVSLLDSVLLTKISVSIVELAETLSNKPLDRHAVIDVVKLSDLALLSFTGASVVSRPLLKSRIYSVLTESAVVSVSRESSKWGVTEDVVARIVEEISEEEGLDVVRTKDDDYILVPDFKDRMRETLEIQGRINVRAESQRMRVDEDELVRLIETWGWELIPTRDNYLVSVKWLGAALVREVDKQGYLDLESAAKRFDLQSYDIQRCVRALKWRMIDTEDGRMVPLHVLQTSLSDKIQADGFLDLKAEEERIKISADDIVKILRSTGLQVIETDDSVLMTFSQLKERVKDDLELAGLVVPEETAAALGVNTYLVTRILEQLGEVRTTKDGKFISFDSFRNWLIDEIKSCGFIKIARVEEIWGIGSVELSFLLKRFEFRTVTTSTGDYLSIAYVKSLILSSLNKGEKVEASKLAKELGIISGVAQALMSQVDSDALLTRDGSLIPVSVLLEELKKSFDEKGFLDPHKEARERDLDLSELLKIIDQLELDSIRTATGKYVNVDTIMKLVHWALKSKGLYDLKEVTRRLRVDYEAFVGAVEENLTNEEVLVDTAQVIVSDRWVALLTEHAKSVDVIRVNSFAKKQGIGRAAALALLRRFLLGAYVSRSDSYILKK